MDHALRLARILQVEGPLRVSEAAERLGIARSTAHRLLAMLVYRDFAEQDDERRYRAGQVLRVGDREGRELPAHLASGGTALLATLAPSEVDELYAGAADGPDRAALARELELIRERGFAINDQLTEAGVMAVGMAVRDPHSAPLAGVSVSLPSVRFDHDRLPGLVGALSRAVTRIERDLAARP